MFFLWCMSHFRMKCSSVSKGQFHFVLYIEPVYKNVHRTPLGIYEKDCLFPNNYTILTMRHDGKNYDNMTKPRLTQSGIVL